MSLPSNRSFLALFEVNARACLDLHRLENEHFESATPEIAVDTTCIAATCFDTDPPDGEFFEPDCEFLPTTRRIFELLNAPCEG